MTTGTAEHSNLRSGDEHISIPAWWREIVQRHGDRELIRYLGKSHRFPPYMESPSLRQRLATGALDGLTDD